MRIPYLLRRTITPSYLLHWCQSCWCRVSGTEPGAISPSESPFPRLCHCERAPRVHVNCGMSGLYCPACAERIRREQAELDEWEKGWM
jgi:hypothetical protein